VIDSNKLSKSHQESNLRLYAHRASPLFNTFTFIEALRWVLLLRDPESSGNQTEYLSHGGSF